MRKLVDYFTLLKIIIEINTFNAEEYIGDTGIIDILD